MFHLIGQLLFGFIVGLIAEKIVPGKYPGGCFVTALIGLAGSFTFAFLARIFFPGILSFEWIGAVLGTMLLLVIYRAATGSKS